MVICEPVRQSAKELGRREELRFALKTQDCQMTRGLSEFRFRSERQEPQERKGCLYGARFLGCNLP